MAISAHLAPANTPGFLDGFKVDRGGVHLALFHGSERGWFTEQGEGKAPHAPFDAGQIAVAGIHHAFLGHYHRPRDYERLTYPGNPDPLSFGEDGPRGAVVVIIGGDGSIRRERVPVAVTEVHDITVEVTGCGSQQDVRSRVQEAVEALRGVARVTLSGELSPAIDLQPHDILSLPTELESWTVEIGDLFVGYDLEAIKNEATVRGEFVRQVTAREVEVMALVGNGDSNRQIGEVLGITVDTVKKHVSQVMKKHGAHSRTEVAILAAEYR